MSTGRVWSGASRALAVVSLVAASATVGVVLAQSAVADGPTTFSNSSAIAIPAAGSPNQIGTASPYPSSVNVSGMTGAVTKVTVAFNGLTHSALNDVDAMVVAPTGANLLVLSDAGSDALTFASNATLTFDDAAAGTVPSGNVPSGTYRPTNVAAGTTDTLPAPAPTPSSQTTLAGAFTGINPNGAWQLFVVDDTSGDLGSMAGGWSLTITTANAALATTTTVTSSLNPSRTALPVTFTATVRAGASAVTTGTVQFADNGVDVGSPVALNGSGQATFSTSALSEGTHAIRATYSGSTGFLTSNGSLSQHVDTPTFVTGNTFCNRGGLTVPAQGASAPYPSNITVTGMAGSLVSVTATLHGLAHAAPVDLDVMMSGPGAKNVVLMSDAGGTDAVSGVDVTFDDAAAGAVPTPVADGTFRPTDDDSDGPDAFPAPAPVPSTATLSTFQGGVVNGTWTLWVVDDASGDSGSIGRWCVTITTTSMLATTVVGAPNPSVVGENVTFTATTTADGLWVHAGTIQFTSDGSNLGAPVPVGPDGKATFSTSVLTAGSHLVTATYLVNPTYPTSSGTTSQVVGAAPAAEAGGPYAVAEGGSLTLAGSVAPADPAATYTWDVNGDGTFGDATGATPTLTWAQLEALGIDDGPSSHVVTLRVTSGALTATDTAMLQVTNVGPSARVSYNTDVRVGVASAFGVQAADASSADMAATFTYVVDWGDGSDLQTVSGSADISVDHAFAAPGTYTAFFGVTDKDGGTTEPLGLEIEVTGSATTTTTTAPPSTTTTATEPPTSTTTSTASTTSTSSSTSPGSTSPPATSGSVPLASTGSNAGLTVFLAALLLVCGATLLALARWKGAARRR